MSYQPTAKGHLGRVTKIGVWTALQQVAEATPDPLPALLEAAAAPYEGITTGSILDKEAAGLLAPAKPQLAVPRVAGLGTGGTIHTIGNSGMGFMGGLKQDLKPLLATR